MSWACPMCGFGNNDDGMVRCICGHEMMDTPSSGGGTAVLSLPNEMQSITGSEAITPQDVFELENPNEADLDGLKAQKDWFIEIDQADGSKHFFGKEEISTRMRAEIFEGKYQKNHSVSVHSKDKDGKWTQKDSPLFEFSKSYFSLRTLYQPVWSHALEGLKWGALAGIGLKLLDTLVLLGTVDPALAFMFLVAIVVCCIPRFGMIGVIGISIFMMKYSKANFFLMGLSAGLVGAILGCLPGMAVGGLIGLARKNSLSVTRDGSSDPEGLFLKAVVLPAIGGCALWIFYIFVFNPWLTNVL
ncbi:MAG: hypothetical protein KKA41_07310 [Proteobacteria bacterium]|nr:hypothetical protein [Pseudomonadota bacterium]